MEFEGLVCPVVTPATDDGDVDRVACRSLCGWLEDAGVGGIAPCGSSGEFASLTPEQHRAAVEAAVQGTDDAFVLAGCGDTSPGVVERLVESAADAGADGVLVVAPSYYSPTTQDALCRFYESIAADAPLPVLLYNNATYSQALTRDSVLDLASRDGIAGIKDSTGSLATVKRLADETPGSFAVLAGTEDQAVAALDYGADGVVPGTSNVFPAAYASLYAAHRAGDRDRAVGLMNEVVVPTQQAVLSCDAVLGALKYLVECGGHDVGDPFPPGAPLSDAERGRLADSYDRISDVATDA